MRVERVLETCLYVDDLELAEEFYTQVLGLSAFSRLENRHVFFRCGTGVFLVFRPEESMKPNDVPTHGALGGSHVAFAVQQHQIASWREHLLVHGVRIEKEVAWPDGGYSLYFRDPSGNSLELATPEVWGIA